MPYPGERRDARVPGAAGFSCTGVFVAESDTETHRRAFEILNRFGLHARAAGLLAETAGRFQADVRVVSNDQTVDGKSILELMLLAAARGTTIEVVTTGPDAAEAMEAIGALIAARFHETE